MSRLVAAPPPNRVRSPTDRQFASACSPRRFEPTQLPLASELWHTPARTFTVLMWRPHRRTHSRMLLAGIQANFGLDPRLKHPRVTTGEKLSKDLLKPCRLLRGCSLLESFPTVVSWW